MAARLFFHSSLFRVLLLVLCAGSIAHAQNEAPAFDPFAEAGIMHVGFINTDCISDTIYGFLDPHNLGWRPGFIRWGRAYDSEGTPLCDSGRYDASIAAQRRVDSTIIIYPDWTRVSCVLSVQRYNANDSLDDAIFWLRGADSVEDALVDTARSLVVFGQRGLDTLSSIDLSSIDAFREEPFYAMELTHGRELINPKKRDITGKKSHELVHVDKNVLKEKKEKNRDSTEAPAPEITSAVPGDPALSARIYPNPAIYTTNVEVRPLAAGTYTVEVVAVNGEQVWREEVTLDDAGEIFTAVDLSGLSSGYYVVRIHTRTELIVVYPIVVIR